MTDTTISELLVEDKILGKFLKAHNGISESLTAGNITIGSLREIGSSGQEDILSELFNKDETILESLEEDKAASKFLTENTIIPSLKEEKAVSKPLKEDVAVALSWSMNEDDTSTKFNIDPLVNTENNTINNSATISLLSQTEVDRKSLKIEDLTKDPSNTIKFIHFNLNASLSSEKSHLFGNAKLSGKIPLMNPIENYNLPEPEDLEFAIKWIQNCLIENHVFRKTEEVKLQKVNELVLDLCLSYAFCVPEINIKDEKSLLAITIIALIFITDDIIEENNLFGQDESGGGFLITEYITKLFTISHTAEFNKLIEKELYPSLRPAARIAKVLLDGIDKYIPEFHSMKHNLAVAVKETYLGVLLLQTADKESEDNGKNEDNNENDRTPKSMSEETFKFLRDSDAAGLPTIECLLILKDIKLDQEIRDNLFYQRFIQITTRIIAYQNDLLGLQKDLEKDEWNIVLFKVKNSGISLEIAFKQVLHELEVLVGDFIYLMDRLRKFFQNNDDLEEFFQLVFTVIDSQGALWIYTTRHGDLMKAFTTIA